jgi:HEAT repeat protein
MRAVLTAAVVGGLAWLTLRLREPVYQGKGLSVWLRQYSANHEDYGNKDLERQAETAIRQIGTNAVPIYLRLITARESRFRLKLLEIVPKSWQARLHIPDLQAYQNKLAFDRWLGAMGIAALGPEAKPFLPDLIGVLKNKDPEVRLYAIAALRNLGSLAHDTLPALIQCLKDPDEMVRWHAAGSLGQMREEPEVEIPVLIESLDAPDQNLHTSALWSLRQYGPAAKAAVPRILKSLNEADGNVRAEATNALKAIDPVAAAKAGVK